MPGGFPYGSKLPKQAARLCRFLAGDPWTPQECMLYLQGLREQERRELWEDIDAEERREHLEYKEARKANAPPPPLPPHKPQGWSGRAPPEVAQELADMLTDDDVQMKPVGPKVSPNGKIIGRG